MQLSGGQAVLLIRELGTQDLVRFPVFQSGALRLSAFVSCAKICW